MTFTRWVVPPLNKEPVATILLKDRRQGGRDKLAESLFCILVQVLHFVDHIGIIRSHVWVEKKEDDHLRLSPCVTQMSPLQGNVV